MAYHPQILRKIFENHLPPRKKKKVTEKRSVNTKGPEAQNDMGLWLTWFVPTAKNGANQGVSVDRLSG